MPKSDRKDIVPLYQEALTAGKVKKYRKIGEIWGRVGNVGEQIITMTDGDVETTNKVSTGDWVLTGKRGEQYVVPDKTVQERYKITEEIKDGLTKLVTKGTCHAFKYKGDEFLFVAPWKELCICKDGDMIASTSKRGFDDVYRIAGGIFAETYVKD